MNISKEVKCKNFPCYNVITEDYRVPNINLDPEKIQMVIISETPPHKEEDYFYYPGTPLYLKTVLQSFNDAGLKVGTLQELLYKGIYITTAVKCGKTGYSLFPDTINNCSLLLQKELSLFPSLKVIMLNGDTAIKAMNYIAKRQLGFAVIPKGATYKIRTEAYFFRKIRVFPSYTITGKNYLIEKSKRRMIAEDLSNAMEILKL